MRVGHHQDHGPLQINLFGGEEAMEIYPGHLVTRDILSSFHISRSNDFARLVQTHLIHPRAFRRGNQRDGEGQARANLLELSAVAQSAEVRSLTNYNKSIANLDRVRGVVLEKHRIQM